MTQLYVLDKSAESRTALCKRLSDFVTSEDAPQDFIPHVEFKPVSPEEIPFLSPPDICVIGSQILVHELTELARVKKQFPEVPILVCTSKELENLSTIEQMARMGSDSTLPSYAKPIDFLRVLIHLSQKVPKANTGSLYLVDGGKGGVGVTSVAAALAEVSAREGKRTLIVDGDSETQDLGRFLQARPYVNENLQLILEGQKPLSKEFVEQCFVKVWQDNEELFCMPAMPNHDALFSAPAKVLRQFLLVFETLDQMFDTIIVDMGCMAGMFQRALYRAADGVVFVLNDDPASLYGSVERLSLIREVLQGDSKLCVVDNAPRGGLSRKVLMKEFSRAAHLESHHWSTASVSYCKQGNRWPGSGATLASLGNRAQLRSCDSLAADLGLVEAAHTESSFGKLFARLSKIFTLLRGSKRQVVHSTRELSGVTEAPILPAEDTSKRELIGAPEWATEGANPLSGGSASPIKKEKSIEKSKKLQDIITPATF